MRAGISHCCAFNQPAAPLHRSAVHGDALRTFRDQRQLAPRTRAPLVSSATGLALAARRPPRQVLDRYSGAAHAPRPAQIRQVPVPGGLTTPVPRVLLFVTLTGPWSLICPPETSPTITHRYARPTQPACGRDCPRANRSSRHLDGKTDRAARRHQAASGSFSALLTPASATFSPTPSSGGGRHPARLSCLVHPARDVRPDASRVDGR
jgi:hypothetical protein